MIIVDDKTKLRREHDLDYDEIQEMDVETGRKIEQLVKEELGIDKDKMVVAVLPDEVYLVHH